MLDKTFLVLEVVHLVVSIAILLVLVDVDYGFTNIRKASKRKLRRCWKKFMKDSKRYFAKRTRKSNNEIEITRDERVIGF